MSDKIMKSLNGYTVHDAGAREEIGKIKPDLAENNPNSPRYVEHRTHWVERDETAVEILPETVFVPGEGESIAAIQTRIDVQIGAEYIVRWNGVDYTVTAAEFSNPDGAMLAALGNLPALLGTGDSGEPFLLLVSPEEVDGVYGAIYIIDGSASVTLSITHGKVEIVHKLDNKFLDLGWIPSVAETTFIAERTVTGGVTLVAPGSTGLGGEVDEGVPHLAEYVYGSMGKLPIVVTVDGVKYEVLPTGNNADGYHVEHSAFALVPIYHATVGIAVPGGGAHTVSIGGYRYNKLPMGFVPDDLNYIPIPADNCFTGEFLYVNQDDQGRLIGVRSRELDKTLTIEGAPADAKAVGDKIAKVSEAINDKLDADKLPEAVNDALVQAKESGEFDGADGKDGSDANVTAENIETALGYTPADNADVEQLSEAVGDETTARENAIADLKAQGVQQTPLFAESVEWLNDNGDTSKVYVLPDGYIYACVYDEYKAYTNAVSTSEDYTGTEIYNGVGYKNGVRLTTTGASTPEGDSTNVEFTSTGYISCRPIDGALPTIYVKGLDWTDDSYARMYWFKPYDASTGFRTQIYGTLNINGTNGTLDTSFIREQLGDKYWRLTPNMEQISTNPSVAINTIDSFRFSLKGTGENLIVSVGNPIETLIGYSWQNTGHAFVPADYEEEIIENKTNIAKLNERVSVLESGGIVDGVESYVQEEAERVADEVYKYQNANTFTFLAISDMHYHTNNSQIITSNIHAGQGMDLVRKGVNIDFAVCLGDNAWGSGIEGDTNRATIELGLAEIRGANKCIDAAFRGIPNFRTPGNHDNLGYNYTWNGNNWLDGHELFPLYGAYNRGAVYPAGEKDRGYCYRDFDEWKLRVICMNSSDLKGVDLSGGASAYMSGTQMKWFAETLDMSAKSDAAEWSVLILSHIPLDYSTSIQTVNILEAYANGTSVSVTKDGLTITYNYSGKNAATIIGNVHGHNHCFLVDNLRKHVGGGVTEPISVKRICIPNACYSRSNERGQNGIDDMYDIEYGETTTYNKTAGTAEDTAFNVVTVDPIARKIYATNYGAGYDREINY